MNSEWDLIPQYVIWNRLAVNIKSCFTVHYDEICTALKYKGKILEPIIKGPLVLTQFETDWFLLRVFTTDHFRYYPNDKITDKDSNRSRQVVHVRTKISFSFTAREESQPSLSNGKLSRNKIKSLFDIMSLWHNNIATIYGHTHSLYRKLLTA
jgi:hypothetical protein